MLQAARAYAVRSALIFLHLLEREPKAVGELLLAHSEHLSGHSDTAAHVFIDGVGSFFDHCLFTIHVCLRRGLRRKGCDRFRNLWNEGAEAR